MSVLVPDATHPQLDNLNTVPGAQSKMRPPYENLCFFPATSFRLHLLDAEAKHANIGSLSKMERRRRDGGDADGANCEVGDV